VLEHSHAEGVFSNCWIKEKIKYIHQNPVETGIVFQPEDYRYSNAVDYAGEKGMIENL